MRTALLKSSLTWFHPEMQDWNPTFSWNRSLSVNL